MVVPAWATQPWYPLYLPLAVQEPSSSSSVGESFTDGRMVVQKALQLASVPEESIVICRASVTETIFKQYSIGLKLWWEFCAMKGLDPYQPETGLNPFLRLPYLVDDPGVCVAKTLLMYLENTKSLRGSENQLIVTRKKNSS
nr:unnamed protein product [Callosobruchus chinensis]